GRAPRRAESPRRRGGRGRHGDPGLPARDRGVDRRDRGARKASAAAHHAHREDADRGPRRYRAARRRLQADRPVVRRAAQLHLLVQPRARPRAAGALLRRRAAGDDARGADRGRLPVLRAEVPVHERRSSRADQGKLTAPVSSRAARGTSCGKRFLALLGMTLALKSVITGSGMAVGAHAVPNSVLEKLMDTTDEWIRTRRGVQQRSSVDDCLCSAELGIEAAENALAAAGRTKEEIDAVIFATMTPNYYFPRNGPVLQSKMGFAEQLPTFDIRQQCSGFLYGHDLADSLIRSGKYRRLLLVG